jgi:hypothetical protein
MLIKIIITFEFLSTFEISTQLSTFLLNKSGKGFFTNTLFKQFKQKKIGLLYNVKRRLWQIDRIDINR